MKTCWAGRRLEPGLEDAAAARSTWKSRNCRPRTGIASVAVEDAWRYAQERKQFGADLRLLPCAMRW